MPTYLTLTGPIIETVRMNLKLTWDWVRSFQKCLCYFLILFVFILFHLLQCPSFYSKIFLRMFYVLILYFLFICVFYIGFSSTFIHITNFLFRLRHYSTCPFFYTVIILSNNLFHHFSYRYHFISIFIIWFANKKSDFTENTHTARHIHKHTFTNTHICTLSIYYSSQGFHNKISIINQHMFMIMLYLYVKYSIRIQIIMCFYYRWLQNHIWDCENVWKWKVFHIKHTHIRTNI